MEAPGTLFVALFGEFDRRSRDASEEDAYSLFHKRSQAMGWLDTRRVIHRRDDTEERVGSPGLWALHDAGTGEVAKGGSEHSPAFWFQVGVAPLRVGDALPTQALLRCIDDVISSQGYFEPKAVQFILPAQLVRVGRQKEIGLSPSVESLAWAAMRDGAGRDSAPATIEVSSGTALPQGFADRLTENLQNFAAEIFGEPSASEAGANLFPIVTPDHLWGGPAQSTFSIRGTFHGWTLEQIGWAATFIADSCARSGISHTIAVTISTN